MDPGEPARRRLPLDPYPFILLNLLFSTQAAYAALLILLSQNRQADTDRIVVAGVLTVCGTVGLAIERVAVRDFALCRLALPPRTLDP